MYYLRARYYDPEISRFITEDPIKDGLNWYAYCYNNPIMLSDPSGLDPYDEFATADEAAADFGRYIGVISIKDEEEYASYIYETVDGKGNKTYYYDEPGNELNTHEAKSVGFELKYDPDAYAVAHTHGAIDIENQNSKDLFSTPTNTPGNSQGSDTAQADKNNIIYYLVSPVGNLKKYEPNSGNSSGILISSDMPVDPKYAIHVARNAVMYEVGLGSGYDALGNQIGVKYTMGYALHVLGRVDWGSY